MAGWEDVRAVTRRLPETVERTSRRDLVEWRVRDRLFAWDRPLRRADLEALGDAAPLGDVLGAYVPDLVAKEALCESDPDVYFTTPHFDGSPIVLAQLDRIPSDELEELLVGSWLERAPERLARAYLDDRPGA